MTDFDALFAAATPVSVEPEIVDSEKGQLPLAEAMQFITAGKSFFTIRSKRSGDRFTFKVSQCEDKETMFFVSVLVGPDNYTNYKYFGLIFTDKPVPVFRMAKPEKLRGITADAPSIKAFTWAFERIRFANPHRDLEFWHAMKCGRCGLMLTDPESIRSGYGPICIDKMMGGE